MRIQTKTGTDLPQLDAIRDRLAGPKDDILETLGLYMESSIQSNFEDQGRPEKWKPLKPATKERKTSNRILIESGLLLLASSHMVDGVSVIIGPTGPAMAYARRHHFGDEDATSEKGIQARPIYVVQDEDNTWIVQTVNGWVLNG